MDLLTVVLGGSLMALATVVVAIITTRANRAVERLRRDVERQKADTADRAEDRARYEGLLAGVRGDLARAVDRIDVLEARDRDYIARVLAHIPWDHRAEDALTDAGVVIGEAPPLL